MDSGSVDLETPLELSPKSPLEALDDALNSVMPNLGTLNGLNQPRPPPRNKANTRGLGLIFFDSFMEYFLIFQKQHEHPDRAVRPSWRSKLTNLW